jgi:hypothetical protein
MGPAMDQRFVFECFDPFRNVADFAIFFSHFPDYGCRVACPGMFRTRTVADLAAGILEMRGFL